MSKRLEQIRTEALAAEFIYTRKIRTLSNLSTAINLLTILLPILVLTSSFILKGTQYEKCADIASVIIGSILLCLVIASLIFKIDQKKENYNLSRRENNIIASDAIDYMEDGTTDESELKWFYKYVANVDSRDKENVGEVDIKLKQEAHREALKRLIPGSADVVCSVCNSSPFNFKKGDCGICGNTLKEKQ